MPPTYGSLNSVVLKTHELLSQIAATESLHLFIVLHNLDGPKFIVSEIQEVMSRLANHPAVHIITSLDNPYLLYRWSVDTNLRFNFLYIPVITYQPYTEELAVAEKLPIFKKSMTFFQVRGTKNVLESMT